MAQHIFYCSEILLHSKEVVDLNSEWSVTLVSFDHVFQNQFYYNWKEKILKEVKRQLKSKELKLLENEICEPLDANLKVNFNIFFFLSNKDLLITKRERHPSTQEVYRGVQINYIDYINQENPKKKKNDGFFILRTSPVRFWKKEAWDQA